MFCWCRPTLPPSCKTLITLHETRSPNWISKISKCIPLVHCQQGVTTSMAALITMAFGWRRIVGDWPPRSRLMYSEEMV